MILPIIVVPCLFGPVTERPFAPAGLPPAPRVAPACGESRAPARPWQGVRSTRLSRLPRRRIGADLVPVAVGFRARLLGLAGLSREQAGGGLLIPHCSSVHTFGMRFALDLVFLDDQGRPLSIHRGVPPRRIVWSHGATAVLELPAGEGGELAGPGT